MAISAAAMQLARGGRTRWELDNVGPSVRKPAQTVGALVVEKVCGSTCSVVRLQLSTGDANTVLLYWYVHGGWVESGRRRLHSWPRRGLAKTLHGHMQQGEAQIGVIAFAFGTVGGGMCLMLVLVDWDERFSLFSGNVALGVCP